MSAGCARAGVSDNRRLMAALLVGVLISPLLVFSSAWQALSSGDLNLADGDTIKGQSSYRLASMPSLSGDGSTVIYGQPGHWADWATRHRSNVQVKMWDGSSWVSKGSLPDDANRNIGYWHDISDTGDVVSYSSKVLDEVFVADWNGSSWVQRESIKASQASVSLIRHALSGDGKVLVVGERGFDESMDANNGKVRTLDWDGSAWVERPSFIGADGESLGNSRMDVTSDGRTISFGGSNYDSSGTDDVGRVRVATWDGTSWTERPQIVGSQANAKADNIVMSDDGSVMAFTEAESGVSGRVRSFDWSGSAWVERPVAADGDIAWIDLDINSSGTTFAVSDNASQKLRVYDWAADSWVQRGDDVPSYSPGGGGHYGNVASLSSDGLMVATSQVYSDVGGFRSGRVDIYRSPAALRGVSFDANGGSGSMSSQISAGSATLAKNTIVRSGREFAGWNTAADGSGVPYVDEESYAFSASTTLYAQWSDAEVNFDGNLGTGSMPAQNGSVSAPLDTNRFSRSGYDFAGWNTERGGTGTAYSDKDDYDFAESVTLYAQWTVASSPAEGAEAEVTEDSQLAPQEVLPSRAPARFLGFATQVLKYTPVKIERGDQRTEKPSFSESVALIAGQSAKVLATADSPQSASFDVGKVQIKMFVDAQNGEFKDSVGFPELTIATGTQAKLQATGLRGNSQMEIFLPASDGSFSNLGQVDVGVDGKVDTSLTFGDSGRDEPLPIGKRYLQLITLDAEGSETVLEYPVTIAQPLPAPAIDRSSGSRPVLQPGRASALNSGTPQTVTVRKSVGSVEVVGETWSFGVETASNDGNVEILALERDEPLAVEGSGFMPGTRADVWLFSDPILLGTVDIRADGTFEATFPVASNLVPTGDHTLQIQGVGEGGFIQAANVGVVVEDRVSTPIIPTDADPVGWVPLMFIGTSLGGLFVLVGVTMAVRGRQRSRDRFVPVSP